MHKLMGSVQEGSEGTYQAEQRRELSPELAHGYIESLQARLLTVFFFARSPDAPRTTIVVFSLSSMVLSVEGLRLAQILVALDYGGSRVEWSHGMAKLAQAVAEGV